MKKVLIIEDEQILLTLLVRKLKEEGYEAMGAYDGEEGMKKVREFMPDLVLLDIVMPRKDGFTVMEEMQADEKLKNIPVVIISNSGQEVELDKARELGVKDWLIKTEFDPKEVIEKVKKQIG